MSRYVWAGPGKIVEISENAPVKQRIHVISDYTEKPLFHPATGKMHDSKSAFRRDTKNSGCVELGNDAPRQTKNYQSNLPNVRQDLNRNWEKVFRR